MPLHDSNPDVPRSNATASKVERRREERNAAAGEVVVRVNNETRVIRAELVDISASGFRIRYSGAILKTKVDAAITYPWGDIKARIMWVRQQGQICEAGFLILP